MNIADCLEAHAVSRGHHPAVVDGDMVVTYGELRARVDGAAANMRAAGIGPGDFVAVMLLDSADHVVVLYALAKVGAVIISIERNSLPSERQGDVAGFDVRAMILDAGDEAIPGTKALSLDKVCAPVSTPVPTAEGPGFDENLPMMVVQSSGTTGTPKRLLWSHAQMSIRGRRQVQCMQLTSEDRYVQDPSLTYVSGSRRCMAMLELGGTVVINNVETAADMPAFFAHQNVTFDFVTPGRLGPLLRALESHERGGDEPDFPALKIVLSGSPILPGMNLAARRYLTPQVWESYGTNEVGDLAALSPEDYHAHPGSAGRLIDGVEGEVVDDHDQRLPAGQIGLIRCRAPDFPTAYFGDDEATTMGFRDGWFYPGDLAAMNEEGYIFLKGRADDAINFGPSKFYPIEVENVLLSHPAVSEAAVVGRHYNKVHQVAVAFVVTSAGATPGEISEFCKERLSYFKAPFHVEIIPRMPKNRRGKILKTALRQEFQVKYGLNADEAGWAGPVVALDRAG